MDEEDTCTLIATDDDVLAGAIAMERCNVKLDDVAGLEGQKQVLREAIVLPFKFPHLFTGRRIPWRGFLLYGPHGTGKSLLLKAVATEADGVTLISISGADLAAKANDGERLLKTLFTKARENKPSIIMIDEIDALSGSRGQHEALRRTKTEFLIQMYGSGDNNHGVFVVGTTQKPWLVDHAVRKRFEKRLYFQLPDAKDRSDMFKLHLGTTQHDLTAKDFKLLGERSEGYSGSDIYHVVQDALMQPVRKVAAATHFKQASGPSRSDPALTVADLLTPCSPCESGATQMDWTTIPEDKLLVPMVTNGDVDKSLRTFTPAFVSQEELERLAEFTNDFAHWY